MTKQSLFTPEVDKYASEMFNQASKARVSLVKNFDIPEVLLYKKYKDTDFVTNGYDYWFKKDISLKRAAAFALMDHFNCKLISEEDESFNKLTYQQVIKTDLTDIKQIFNYLESRSSFNGKRNLNTRIRKAFNVEEDEEIFEPAVTKSIKTGETRFSHSDQLSYKIAQKNKKSHIQDQDSELAEEEEEDSVDWNDDSVSGDDDDNLVANVETPDASDEDDDDEEESNQGDYYGKKFPPNCCQKHHYNNFDPLKSKSLKKFTRKLEAIQTMKKNDLKDKFTILIMDKRTEISLKNIIISETHISFKNTIPQFNFAGSSYDRHKRNLQSVCWVYGHYKKSDYVVSKQKSVALYEDLPSVPYQVTDQGYHLKLELFQNNLIRKAEETLEEYFIDFPKYDYIEDEHDEDYDNFQRRARGTRHY